MADTRYKVKPDVQTHSGVQITVALCSFMQVVIYSTPHGNHQELHKHSTLWSWVVVETGEFRFSNVLEKLATSFLS